jgi:hypothetical protein
MTSTPAPSAADTVELLVSSPRRLRNSLTLAALVFDTVVVTTAIEPIQRVHQDIAFTAFDVFARVIATYARSSGRFHALAAQWRSGGG